MSLMPEHSMEVDPPPTPGTSTSTSGGNLKRSNSAPMINVLVSLPETSPPMCTFKASEGSRLRRFSSSSMCLNAGATTPVKIPDRVNRLKEEEIHIAEKEKEHEREVSSAIRMSNSWDEFSLDDHEPMMSDQQTHRRPRSFSESLHVSILPPPNMPVGAPSPTRAGIRKQCFSPSMQIAVKSNSFTPSPSPSPTRKSFMRSLSPIAVRPNPLGKRKLESDMESYLSPPKRFNTGLSTPDRVLAHPLAHSISSSSLDDGSPEQIVPRSGMSEMPVRPHPQPHLYGFMPLRDNSHDMHTTDSENDTDISDQSISLSGSPGSGFQPVRQTHL